MFEKELEFALNNGWAIEDFIAEMTTIMKQFICLN